MHKQIIRITALLAVIALAPGCLKSPLKKNTQLTPRSKQTASYEQTIHGVTLRAHELSNQECKNLLGTKKPRDTSIMQVDVTNNYTVPWTLNKKTVDDVYILPEDIIVEKFQPTTKRALIQMAGFLPFVPLGWAFTGTMIAGIAGPHLLLLLGSLACAGAAVTCATLTNKRMNNNKEKLDIQLTKIIQHISPDALVIQPDTTQSMLLFVDGKRLPPSFDIPLHEANNPANTRTFSVRV